jgi:hypothetical protein
VTTTTAELTTSQTYRRDHGKGHVYYLDGQKVTGVTTAIGSGFPKNLAKWGAETVANKAIDEWSKLARMPVSQRLKELSSAPWTQRDNAAIRGTRIHAVAEQIASGASLHIPEDIAGHVQSCIAFLRDWQVQPIGLELPVFSRKYGYGGTADLFASMADGKVRLCDYKSSKSGIWGDVAFQLAAYRYAEFALDSEGNEITVPEVDECIAVWLRADGYEVYPIEVNRRVFRQFLAIMQVSEAVEESKFYRGDPMRPPVKLGDDS